MYALVKNGTVEKYPYTVQDLKRDNPNTSFPLNLRDEVLRSFDVQIVQQTIPSYDSINQKIEESQPVFDNGVLKQVWIIVNCTEQEKQAVREKYKNSYENALTNLFNSKAQEKKYDNFITCSLRASYTGPYQQEGIAFAEWMDNCNVIGYQIINDVLEQRRSIITVEQFLSEIPNFDWNNI